MNLQFLINLSRVVVDNSLTYAQRIYFNVNREINQANYKKHC
jgi:hypothetical protein